MKSRDAANKTSAVLWLVVGDISKRFHWAARDFKILGTNHPSRIVDYLSLDSTRAVNNKRSIPRQDPG
jgi:hypothetical protein